MQPFSRLLSIILLLAFFSSQNLQAQDCSKVIKENKKIVNYPIVHYWLDIGNPTDFERAQEDVKHIKF